MTSSRSGLFRLLAACFALTFVVAACGSDDDDTEAASAADEGSAEGGDGDHHSEVDPAQIEAWQEKLNAVGCYAGPVDGELGPQTEAAIQAFQAAEGLTVDGLFGPQTEADIDAAIAEGRIVCTTTDGDDGSTDAAAPAPEIAVTSASYSQNFTVGSCSSADSASVELQGQVNNLTVLISASGGTGTLAIDGGTEGDGITLNGTVESVTVTDDGTVMVSGTFTEPNNVGETFTVSGNCWLP